jgi:hypothetical protein
MERVRLNGADIEYDVRGSGHRWYLSTDRFCRMGSCR